MKYEIIINPAANRGRSKLMYSAFTSILKRKGVKFSHHFTEYPGHGIGLSREIAEDSSVETLMVFGGDGTYNEVVNGCQDRDIKLALFPGGTCNDFTRDIGKWQDLETFFECISAEKTVSIDAGKVNNRIFLNNMGVGFDASVIKDMLKRNLKTNLGYVGMSLKNLFQFKNFITAINGESSKFKGKVLLLTVNNGSTYGGGFKIAPAAELNDNLLDICLIKEINRAKFIFNFPRVYSGKHLEIDEVEYWKDRKIDINLSRKLPVQVDGDILEGEKSYLQVEVIPSAFEVYRYN